MLSKKQQHILKLLYPDKTVDANEFSQLFKASHRDNNCKELFLQKYLYEDTSRLYQPALISLTESGRAYVESLNDERKELRRMRRHDRINTVIACVALVVSIIALVYQFKH